jgi:ABC-type phosphate/phosphonate transport system substrate-binding protein
VPSSTQAGFEHHGGPRIARRRWLAAAASILTGAQWLRGAESKPLGDGRLRIAISASMLGDVNENDARASMRAWVEALCRQTGVDLQYEHGMLLDSAGLLDGIRRFQVDSFAITSLEYCRVSDSIDPNGMIIDAAFVGGGEEYCLLVHRNRGIRGATELKGRTLLVHRSPGACLAPAWLDTAVADVSPGGFDRHFSQVTYCGRLSKAVLPVYFQQADVCLVEHRSFLLMSELNPQLSRDLQVILRSPKIVPHMLAFHRRCAPAKQAAFRKALLDLHQSAAGKQALTLFQSGKLLTADHTILRSAVEIATASDRIRGRAQRKRA